MVKKTEQARQQSLAKRLGVNSLPHNLGEIVDGLPGKLSRSITAFKSYYALEGKAPRYDKEIAEELGVTSSRVNQMVHQVLIEVRHRLRLEAYPLTSSDPALRERTVQDLSISKRSFNALYNDCIETIGDLMGSNVEELLRVPNLGRKSVQEIQMALRKIEFELPEK